jgi:guanine nucleotide-binding protein G(i) subunit alpha
VDVGGQRSERRKWINCFENVTSLLFVASLSDYDLFLTRDELRAGNIDDPNASVNRMQDALGLFRVIINWKKKIYANESKKVEDSKKANKPTNASKQPNGVEKEVLLFDKISIILFLNKEDVFEKKFGRSSIKTCFPDYDERLSCEESKAFIARKFIESDKSSILPDGSKREIYWHYTFALDRNNIDTVVTSVKDRIIKYMLDSMRL